MIGRLVSAVPPPASGADAAESAYPSNVGWEHGIDRAEQEEHDGDPPQARSILRRNSSTSPSMGARTCSVLSRSRTVTAPSSSVSKSTVTHQGVPTSSWRRYRLPMDWVTS